MKHLNLFFLGSPRIERGENVISPDTRKAIALLARLTLSGERLSRDMLAAFLWPESDERRAKAALRRTLSDLKKHSGEGALLISRDSLGVNLGSVWCDVLAFQEALSAVQEHGHARGICDGCLPRAEAAISLYRDDFLAGFYLRDSRQFDDWQLQQTEYLRREFAALLELVVQTKELAGAFEEAIPLAQKWLQLDPLREEAHRHLIQLYTWTGQRTAALKQYRSCVRFLEEELGVAPLEETTALYEAVLEDRLTPPQIELPPTPLAATEAAGSRQTPAAIPFVGREKDLAAANKIYDQVGPDGRFLVLSGEAGIGKTRLAEIFLDGLGRASILRARCYPGETQLTFAPFVQAMRSGMRRPDAAALLSTLPPAALAEAARLLPELEDDIPDLPAAPPLDWPGAQGRFFDGLGRVLDALLSGEQPGVLWLDDLQWADTASLDLLAFLVRRRRERPSLLLVCWRSGDLTGSSPLRSLLAEARREGMGARVALARLQPRMVAEIVAAYGREAIASEGDQFSERLYAETEGLPFLVAAYVQTRPEVAEIPDSNWHMPPTVRDLFHSRLAAIAETERQILQTAAVIGRACGFQLLQTVSGRSDEETITALEAALAHLLLIEEPPDLDYDFSHHKLRDLILEEMSLARKRLLHRRVAKALTTQHGAAEKTPSEISARIAGHYEQAGMDRSAAAYYFQAGDYARSLFANREALQHFLTAMALGHPEPCALHEICGDLQVRLGEYSAALNSFERAAATCAPQQLPQLEHKIGQVYYRRGEWGSAEQSFRQAERSAQKAATADELAWLYLDWSYAVYRSGDLAKARQLVDRAGSLASSPQAEAQLRNIRGILARHDGQLDAAVEHFSRSYHLAQAYGLMSMEITSANNLALAETAAGDHAGAQQLFETALRLCQRYGDRHWEAAIHNNLADLFHATGQEEEAMAQLKQSISILATIGREAGDWQPEIWKLSEW